jgi:hypothetical protein
MKNENHKQKKLIMLSVTGLYRKSELLALVTTLSPTSPSLTGPDHAKQSGVGCMSIEYCSFGNCFVGFACKSARNHPLLNRSSPPSAVQWGCRLLTGAVEDSEIANE